MPKISELKKQVLKLRFKFQLIIQQFVVESVQGVRYISCGVAAKVIFVLGYGPL